MNFFDYIVHPLISLVMRVLIKMIWRRKETFFAHLFVLALVDFGVFLKRYHEWFNTRCERIAISCAFSAHMHFEAATRILATRLATDSDELVIQIDRFMVKKIAHYAKLCLTVGRKSRLIFRWRRQLQVEFPSAVTRFAHPTIVRLPGNTFNV